jgi:hypothetical protein
MKVKMAVEFDLKASFKKEKIPALVGGITFALGTGSFINGVVAGAVQLGALMGYDYVKSQSSPATPSP